MSRLEKLFKKRISNNSPELKLIDSDTPFAIRQAYKALYTNILYINVEDKCKKIAVTSALPAECKTTVSSNLALTLAQNLEEKRILLIDSDMRSPKVWRLFGFDRNSHGLSEYLAGIDNEPNFQTVKDYKLTVLSAGGQSVNPTKLMGSQRMKNLLDLCNENFDYVIIDTPPVNVISDALLLNGLVNGYIISARADRSDINSMGECTEAINRIGAEIYGVVISDLKLKANSSKYSKYNKYSRYSAYQNDSYLESDLKDKGVSGADE